METTDLIVVKQLPVIEERLRSMSEDVAKTVSEAMALVCTEETVKSVKAIRASLTKQFTALEDQRKTVKKAVLTPYETFERIYKECVSDKFKSADADLKRKIDEVEAGLKDEKAAEVKAYFSEYAQSLGIDFVSFERAGIQVTLSASLKSLKTAAKDFLDKVSDELALINTQEHKAEILVEYKASLNVAAAITKVSARHVAIEAENARLAEIAREEERAQEAIERVEAFGAPEVAAQTIETPLEPIYTMVFKAAATLAQLKGLKQYMIDNGIKFEKVEA